MGDVSLAALEEHAEVIENGMYLQMWRRLHPL